MNALVLMLKPAPAPADNSSDDNNDTSDDNNNPGGNNSDKKNPFTDIKKK